MPASSPIDLIDTLTEQHERIRELLAEVESTDDAARQDALDELGDLLVLHETGEGYLTAPDAGSSSAEAADLARRLTALDAAGPDFAAGFARFAADVRAHAEREEREEFPAARAAHSPDELHEMGNRLLKAERGTLSG
ncbi:hemerythrin domain-containing protein [Actinacidiphila acididurans]|uniref:Hemerythrin domain-containing protein n=1 Tax=Actinacidiphila acididurans TaxID=2784346 RepID=A0ABS2TJ70_9ACTN|nr:hemerythrin domain-containing protein [Actinacidiphila acididurans]MBM9503384.1 hemerythrin domain-containing protein [Actinacidiphila acididurans]